jgi:hypothetical protein
VHHRKKEILSDQRKKRTRRQRWENNIKMCLQDVGWEAVAWLGLVKDGDKWRAVVSTVMNSRVP